MRDYGRTGEFEANADPVWADPTLAVRVACYTRAAGLSSRLGAQAPVDVTRSSFSFGESAPSAQAALYNWLNAHKASGLCASILLKVETAPACCSSASYIRLTSTSKRARLVLLDWEDLHGCPCSVRS